MRVGCQGVTERGLMTNVDLAALAIPLKQGIGRDVTLIEKVSQPLDVLNGVGRKQDHPILRGVGCGSCVHRTPACHPGLHVVQRHRGTRLLEGIEPPAVLADIGSRDIDHGIQQRHGFREHRGDLLSALVSHRAQTRISVGVDIQRAADDVHEVRIMAEAWICRDAQLEGRVERLRSPTLTPAKAEAKPIDCGLRWGASAQRYGRGESRRMG